jgi:hypothetical protein
MYFDLIDTEKEIKSNNLKNWFINQFEKIVGEFPEIETKDQNEDILKKENKSLLKKHKTLRYLIFPFVFILIIIDESYIRIKESLLKIDESE